MTTQQLEQTAPKAKIEAGGKIQAIVPRDIEEAFRMAEAIFVSGMYPDSYAADANGKSGRQMGPIIDKKATVSRIMIGIQKAMEVGLAPITGLSTIYIVNNRPTIFGDGIPALLYGSGKVSHVKEWFTGEWGKDDFTAHCEVLRKDSIEPIHREFSWADAKKAGLTGKTGPWTTHPKRQLQMRARGFAARDGAADILSGLGIYEEVIDIPEKAVVVDTSSLDDNPTTPSPETHPPVSDNQTTPQLPAPDNSNLMPDLQFEEPIAVVAENATVEESVFRKNDAFGLPVCMTCNGKQAIHSTQENPETGEIEQTIEPCPDCNKPTTNR